MKFCEQQFAFKKLHFTNSTKKYRSDLCTHDDYTIQNSARFHFTRSLRSNPLSWFWFLARFLPLPNTWLLRLPNAWFLWLLRLPNACKYNVLIMILSFYYPVLFIFSSSQVSDEKLHFTNSKEQTIQNMKILNISGVCTMGNMRKSRFTTSTENGAKKKRSH